MKRLTLSFDNGPDPEVTPLVLDVLRRHEVLSSFFVVGERLRDPARRAACERARDEGHWIGNHTYNHIMPLGMTEDAALTEREISAAQDQIGALSKHPPLFRPSGSFGALNATLFNRPALSYLLRNGFTCVLWNTIPRDWSNPLGWTETALQQCAAQQWPFLVLHDVATGAMNQLDRFLHQARDAGFEIVQDFPPDCVPIVGGQVVRPIETYVSD